MTKNELKDRLLGDSRPATGGRYFPSEKFDRLIGDIEKGLPEPHPEGTAVYAFLRVADAIPGTYCPESWDVIADRIIAKVAGLNKEVAELKGQLVSAHKQLSQEMGWRDEAHLAVRRIEEASGAGVLSASWAERAENIIQAIGEHKHKVAALEAEVEAAKVQVEDEKHSAEHASNQLSLDRGWQNRVLTEFCRIADALGTGTGGTWTQRADQIIAAIKTREKFEAATRRENEELGDKLDCVSRANDRLANQADPNHRGLKQARDAFQRVGNELDLDLGDLPWDMKAVAIIDAIDDMKETVGELLADEPCDDELLAAELKAFPVELPPGHFLMLARTDEFFPSPVTQTGEACDGC